VTHGDIYLQMNNLSRGWRRLWLRVYLVKMETLVYIYFFNENGFCFILYMRAAKALVAL